NVFAICKFPPCVTLLIHYRTKSLIFKVVFYKFQRPFPLSVFMVSHRCGKRPQTVPFPFSFYKKERVSRSLFTGSALSSAVADRLTVPRSHRSDASHCFAVPHWRGAVRCRHRSETDTVWKQSADSGRRRAHALPPDSRYPL